MSDKINIYEKLLNIQNELNVPKKRYNSFGKFYSRNCEDILEALKPLCKKHRTLLTSDMKIITIQERYYVEATVTLIDIDNPTDKISATAQAREDECKAKMDGSQTTGSASSYAKKYALGHLFNIDDNKDADELPHEEYEDKEEELYINNDMVNSLMSELKRTGYSVKSLCRVANAQSIYKIKYSDYNALIRNFEKLPTKESNTNA